MRSILFGESGPPADLGDTTEPEYFRDLNLDQVVRAVTKAGGVPGLAPYFHRPLRDPALVTFRQQIFRDLENPAVYEVAARFTTVMERTRQRLEALARRKHPPQAHWWFLEIALDHTAAVIGLAEGLAAAPVTSPGLSGLRDDVTAHTGTASFIAFREQAGRLRERLGEVRYDLFLRGDQVTVAAHDPDARFDYAERVLTTFARFRQDPSPVRRDERPPELGLDDLEAKVLDLVVELHPEVFGDVAAFCARNRGFVTDDIARVDHELRFYLGYLTYLAPLRESGLPICHPRVSATDKSLLAREVYDLALAAKGVPVVVNDLRLDGDERVLVVSGPNQGGKTTLSRAFGQLHHLAALGCPVPGSEVRIFLPDRILTHYERPETIEDLTSKLEDELLRMRAVLDRASPASVIVLNEVFASTTADDARALSETILSAITRLDAPCLWVSFVDELALLSPKAVSMVAESDAAHRFRVVRRPADGRAHAMAIAERHGLTYSQIMGRVRA